MGRAACLGHGLAQQLGLVSPQRHGPGALKLPTIPMLPAARRQVEATTSKRGKEGVGFVEFGPRALTRKRLVTAAPLVAGGAVAL
jgi:hypothetical protein